MAPDAPEREPEMQDTPPCQYPMIQAPPVLGGVNLTHKAAPEIIRGPVYAVMPSAYPMIHSVLCMTLSQCVLFRFHIQAGWLRQSDG